MLYAGWRTFHTVWRKYLQSWDRSTSWWVLAQAGHLGGARLLCNDRARAWKQCHGHWDHCDSHNPFLVVETYACQWAEQRSSVHHFAGAIKLLCIFNSPGSLSGHEIAELQPVYKDIMSRLHFSRHAYCTERMLHEELLLQATYDASSQGFILNTPTNTASKFWIGGAGTSATVRMLANAL